jgi:hypothetical protein
VDNFVFVILNENACLITFAESALISFFATKQLGEPELVCAIRYYPHLVKASSKNDVSNVTWRTGDDGVNWNV